ncbi:uncharacterized protein LOC119106327 [Pollicipes pollicipes]|uniref:uncharacterized protein LOC119106327 n=1 Tax=Pollicipes pollicipes TaxID=41117 RepID=UPI0018853887|nr:uncharacterized protein LOC119106327 [Pollicipes pollicipes]
MLRPEPMPTAVVGSPAEELDTSCLNCFSRRVGIIVIGWVIVLMSIPEVVTTWKLMTVSSGGGLAIAIIYMLILLVDGTLAALLLLGLRDGVVRTRLNIWMVWTAVYTVLLLLLFIIFVATVPSVTLATGVLGGFNLLFFICFRVYCLYAGWKYREVIMSAPPPATDIRPDPTYPAF